ncbi:hypothetical protein [Hydrogenophaga sp. MI9]|uniref:hypothetical protein n=1 Tax=Hydrogenophaga sp. MI9 TaxID=3453719 RepID=UPI003EE91568
MSSFPRRGHFRTAPSGEKTWVRPHTVDRTNNPSLSSWLPQQKFVAFQNRTTNKKPNKTINASPSEGRHYLLNPNASCPVCGANVFFYKSPYDGRVFFDELGPPWSKHPCTIFYEEEIPGPSTCAQEEAAWKKNGWRYIASPRATRYGQFTELKGYSKGSRILLYLPLSIETIESEDTHIHFKTNKNQIDISFYSFSMGHIETKAYDQPRTYFIFRLATSIQRIAITRQTKALTSENR